MTRYVTRPVPRGWIEDQTFDSDAPLLPSLSVDGGKHLNTGLVDAKGNAIYRMQAPCGFGRDGEGS